MAKKKKAKAKTKRYNGKAAPAYDGAARRARAPRSEVLPGMEQVRSRKLDRLCESIGDARDRMNEAKQQEAGDIQAALQVMQAANQTVYKHAGVELVRVPGADKLRVRLTKEHGDAGIGTPNDEVGDERREAVEDLEEESGTTH